MYIYIYIYHFVEKKNTLGVHLFQKLALETSEGATGGSSCQRGHFQSEKGWLEELPVGGGWVSDERVDCRGCVASSAGRQRWWWGLNTIESTNFVS